MPPLETFQEDRNFLFLPHLHDNRVERGEGITSFFVLKAMYFAFLGPSDASIHLLLGTQGTHNVSQIQHEEEQERLEQQQQQWREREQQQRLEREQQEQQMRENRARQEREQQEMEREEREREEAEWWKRERQVHQDRLEREQVEQQMREDKALQERGRERGREREWEREREPQEWLDTEAQEQQRLEEHEQEKQGPQARDMICIHFKTRENSIWRDVQSLWVSRSDPSEVARVAKKNMRKGLRTFDTNGQLIAPDDIFEAVTVDGTNTVLLIPQRDLDIDDGLLDSANVLAYVAIAEGERSKRLKP